MWNSRQKPYISHTHPCTSVVVVIVIDIAVPGGTHKYFTLHTPFTQVLAEDLILQALVVRSHESYAWALPRDWQENWPSDKGAFGQSWSSLVSYSESMLQFQAAHSMSKQIPIDGKGAERPSKTFGWRFYTDLDSWCGNVVENEATKKVRVFPVKNL